MEKEKVIIDEKEYEIVTKIDQEEYEDSTFQLEDTIDLSKELEVINKNE